jgi:SPP1 gp7 family putative phage head morphogenesis protein
MKNDAYWANRMRILEDALLDTGYEYVQNLERQYDKAIRDIETDIARWYQRFAKNNEISLNDARKLLNSQELKEFKWTVEEYIKYGKENAVNGAWIKQLENASARVHISRLEAIKLQLQQQAEALAAKQAEAVKGVSEGVYKSSYYHTAFELQKGVGVGWTLHAIDENVIEKVLARPWTLDKQTFSDRIWANKQALVNTVNTQITQMVMRGAAPDNTIKAIADRFKVSKSQAGRLVMTESAAFANEARKDCFKDLDVEKYVIVETLDGKTCSLCAQLDGKVYPMSEYAIGVTAPPFHPWCRGTTAPYFDDMDDIAERWARDPETGKTYTVPGSMTYKQWAAKQTGLAKSVKPLEKSTESGIMSLPDIEIGKSVGAKAKNYDIRLPNNEIVHLSEGTRITNVQVIAGKGRNRKIDMVSVLIDRYPGTKETEWQKVKGIGYIDYQGENYKAVLHWYQEPSVGKVEWKVKPDADGNWFIDED